MPSQQLLLSWKDHNGAVVSVFENLLRKNTLVDCTLAAEGQYLKAHKVVLSACSSYFELLFSQESEKNPIVVLKDVKFQELKAAVNFMYKGEVEVNEDRLTAFLEVADSLQIKGLGSDEKSQRSKEKSSSSLKSLNAKSAVTPRQQTRKDVLSSHSDSAGRSPNVPADCELVKSNESSSGRQLPRSESSRSSPPLPASTSFSQRRQDTGSDKDNLENSPGSALPHFPSGENEQSDINAVIKTEPVNDAYDEEKSEEVDGDFGDDVTMMEDEDDWDEHNVETMSDEQSTSQQDLGFATVYLKSHEGTSESVEEVGEQPGNFSSSEGAATFEWGRPLASADRDRAQSASSSPCASWGSRGGRHQQLRPGEPQYRAYYSAAELAETTTWSSAAAAASSSASAPEPPMPPPRPSQKKYNCPICQKVFFASNMPRHLRAHMGVRPYTCPDCNYAATDSGNLKRHRRMHTGERPYSCSLCGKTFAYSSALRIHLARHNAEQRPP